ncbi:MAG: TlpA family protein disulfide reductase [Burkholderiales bacterium]|nr:TlpA family protein disulfide reductase [Burkholderiales bacterium]
MKRSANIARYACALGGLLVVILTASAVIWTPFAGRDGAAQISPAALYAVQLTDSRGNSVSLGLWQGKILLVNFWATWCLPCREEIPDLMRVQRRHAGNGVQVIGVAIDSADKVLAFVRDVGVDYPVLIDDSRGLALSKRLGNGAGVLPFTALINREGKVVSINKGKLSPAQIDAQLKAVIQQPFAALERKMAL